MKRAYGLVVVAAITALVGESPIQAQQKEPPRKFTNSIGMKFIWIPPGTFQMGSPKDEGGRGNDETQHQVTLTKGFYLGVHLVTQDQWKAVMDCNYSKFKGDKSLPVERVNWEECQVFLQKMGKKDGHVYRLPTEAEWEFACRAGSKAAYSYGADLNLLDQYAWYDKNSEDKTHPVGQKRPNGWGLYDMQGNVWQWCADWYGEYPQNAVVDPQGPFSDPSRISENISEFILQLSSPKFVERQAATKALKEIGWPTLPALRKVAINGPDLETQLRARQLMAAIPGNSEGRVLRGGAFYDQASSVRAACRAYSLPGNYYYSFSLRVATNSAK